MAAKLETIRLCGELGIGVILVPTVVPGVNDHNLGSIIDLALEWLPVVRGCISNPLATSGVIPSRRRTGCALPCRKLLVILNIKRPAGLK